MKEIYEKCILCNGVTSVRKSTPICKRYGYVEGSGQLCERCFKEYSNSSSNYRITANASKYLKNFKQ